MLVFCNFSMLVLLLLAAFDPKATTAAVLELLGPGPMELKFEIRCMDVSAVEWEGDFGCAEDELSGKSGLGEKGRAVAVASDRIIEDTKSSHMAASDVGEEEASAAASTRQAATNWAASDNTVAAFIPSEELGRRRNRCTASTTQQAITTAAGTGDWAPEAARVAPPAIPMATRRQQRRR